MSTKYSTIKSKELYEQAKRTLVKGIASSFHKAPYEKYPIYFTHGKGSRIYDVDGNEYVEYGDFGPMILGYCHPSIEKAVTEQLAKGSLFPGPYRLLNNVSEQVTGLSELGTDLGAFLTNLAPGVGAFVIILGLFGGIAAIVYAIVSVIKKRVSMG